ncbi:MAG: DUF5104 domain-containing protein [Clostridia bacterium]|nr:DUF5104 domain-containing protein [Clostridia bacterium]
MKKIIVAFLCVICLVSLGGCRSFFVDEEQELYDQAVTSLFDALDRRDVEGIYNLFSPAVRNENEDLKDTIEKLISFYSGPTDQIGDVSSLGSESLYEEGEHWHNAYTTFPVLSEGNYYWVYLNLMYDNTFNESRIGITQLDFYGANDYYEFRNSDELLEDSSGLHLYNQSTGERQIISINNYPYEYREADAISIEQVKRFLETSVSLVDFKKQFGEAAASNEFGSVYLLPDQNGEKRFLNMTCEGDKIVYAKVFGSFSYIGAF